MRAIEVHGHRGAPTCFPENTIAGFEHAIRLGVDAIELDVAVTMDDRLVVSHEPLLDGVPIRTLTETHLPTLEDVFSLARAGSFHFDVELKSFVDKPQLTPSPRDFAKLAMDVIERYKLQARVNLFCFDFRVLQEMRDLSRAIRCAALYEGPSRSFVEVSEVAGGTPIVCPRHTLVTPTLVSEAHAAGLKVFAWTANTPDEWDRLIDARVDAVITDHPASLIAQMPMCHNASNAIRDPVPSPRSPSGPV